MKSSPQIITSALQLYFTGESLRNTQKFLRLQGVYVNHNTIYKWIRKYVSLMEVYLSQNKPNVGDTWRADELWLKVKGNMKYLFALMDDETRFWIAQEVGDTKYKHDAGNLFRKGKEAIGRVPATLITDGLVSYHEAYKKEFFTIKPRIGVNSSSSLSRLVTGSSSCFLSSANLKLNLVVIYKVSVAYFISCLE